MSAEIQNATDEPIQLVPGSGGIFEIRKDGKLLWKKERGGPFPAEGEAARLFRT